MAPKSVLVVDDEPEIGEVLSAYLVREGFEVISCTSVGQAAEALARGRPDFMVLDITLPDGSGLDILRGVEAKGHIPTIVLTARADEVDRIVGLELGADDYVTKPFSPRELIARVRAVLRRFDAPHVADAARMRYRVGDIEIDASAHEVSVAGRRVAVTPSEFRILCILAENAGQVLTRTQLLDLLDDDGSIYERTLDRHVNNLRKRIEPDPERPRYVITIYGVGYKLVKD